LNNNSSNVGDPNKILYSEDGNDVTFKISMNNSQKEAYLENFLIKRENKKRD
jgi:hypothetical protein